MVKKKIKFIAAATAMLMSVGGMSACGLSSSDNDKGQVYYLNSKPEVVDQFQELADEYTKETGIQVNVQTATSDNYESTLTSELGKSNAPTMFNVSGYPSFAKIKQYLEPMQKTDVYGLLTDEGKEVTMSDDSNTLTIPFVAEYNGIIYNKKIIKNYCTKSYAKIKSDADIINYSVLKSVVEDMQAHKDDLGLDGAFASPGLDTSGSWRFDDHMARIPISAEFRDEGKTFAPEITGIWYGEAHLLGHDLLACVRGYHPLHEVERSLFVLIGSVLVYAPLVLIDGDHTVILFARDAHPVRKHTEIIVGDVIAFELSVGPSPVGQERDPPKCEFGDNLVVDLRAEHFLISRAVVRL